MTCNNCIRNRYCAYWVNCDKTQEDWKFAERCDSYYPKDGDACNDEKK